MARERKFTQDTLFQATKQILLQSGYEGFTFTLLAEQLDVSRAALYKYFNNKEELITDYMIFEMNIFLKNIQKIENYTSFDAQFDYLLTTMFQHKDIHEILGITYHISANSNEKVKTNIEKLKSLHLDMHKLLQGFIQLGRLEKRLKKDVSNEVLLGFIFQSINIPNHFEIPSSEWMIQIKEMISHGIFTNNN